MRREGTETWARAYEIYMRCTVDPHIAGCFYSDKYGFVDRFRYDGMSIEQIHSTLLRAQRRVV